MPGMSFVCDLIGSLKGSESIISRSLDSMIHTERYERRTLLDESSYFLGCTKYEGYPVAVLETGDVYVYLEGRMYGKSSARVTHGVTQLAERVFRPQVQARETVGEWLLGTDGDFLVFMLHKSSSEIAIVNDALGRLPVYYCETNSKFLAARELRFITDVVPGRKFDKMAIAQYLLLGYPLGQRTLLENVNRLAPASLIRISLEKRKIEIQGLHDWNLEEKKHRQASVAGNASQLVSLFSEACRSRTDPINRSIVSLSGGLDSRSVAACLNENRIPFSAVTFLDSARGAEADARIAGHLARALGAEWRIFHLSPPTGRDLLRLLKAKGGLNSLEMGFILPFFDRIIEAYGSRVTYLTGDGGDKVLPSHLPAGKLRGLDDLIAWIVSTRRIFTLDDVSTLTAIYTDDIVDEIRRNVLSYPETDWNAKWLHFRIFERGFKWTFEGEDRNRFFFWSAAPFYSIRFFEYAMNCPDEQKTRYVLYRDFLSRLSRRASRIPDEGGKLATARRARLPGFVALSRLLRSGRLGILGRLLSSGRRSRVTGLVQRAPLADANSALVSCLMAQIGNCEPVLSYLSRSGILTVLGDCAKRSKQELASIFTIASAIEASECGTSTIERYADSAFV